MRCRIVSSKEVYKEGRFDGSYHNAESIVYDNVIKAHSSHNLAFYCSDIFTSGRNKRAYTTSEYGYPFLSNSDASSLNPFYSCKYTSKKYGFDERSLLKEGMILTGRVGAIGQTSFVPKYWEDMKAIGSDNIIRIQIKPEYKNGLIYAYLASRIGNLSFWKYATGGVQPFISDAMVGQLPIPDFSTNLEESVNSKIHTSASLRGEAAKYINDAIECLDSHVGMHFEKHYRKSQKVSICDVMQSLQHRIDPPALINDGVYSMSDLVNNHTTHQIGRIDGVRVYRPGIFKRNYVENGIPYIKGSEVFLTSPFRKCEQLSRTRTPFIDEMSLKEGQVLITCAGSVGDIRIITKEYEEKKAIGSQDIIRLESTNSLFTREYLFVYLQLPFVYDYIQSMKYGSVIERIEPFHVESIPVYVPSEELSQKITSSVKKYMECLNKAFRLEEEALVMIEEQVNIWKNE